MTQEQYRDFLSKVGVKTNIDTSTMFSIDDREDPEWPEYPGYFKFDTGRGLNVDQMLADEFEAWLKDRGFNYVRGYPDDRDDTDRRFCIDRAATDAILEAAKSCGLTKEDIDNA